MLKTLQGLKGVTVLPKDAQKRIKGGVMAPITCGIIVTAPGSNTEYVLYMTDTSGNGKTKDEAIYSAATSNDIYGPNGSYVTNTGRWCCTRCTNFPSIPE